MAFKGVTLQLGKEERPTGSKAQAYRLQENHRAMAPETPEIHWQKFQNLQ